MNLSTYLPIYLSVYLPVCLSAYLSCLPVDESLWRSGLGRVTAGCGGGRRGWDSSWPSMPHLATPCKRRRRSEELLVMVVVMVDHHDDLDDRWGEWQCW